MIPSASNYCNLIVNQVINLLLSLNLSTCFFIGFGLLVCSVSFKRLSLYSKPDSPYVANMVRGLSYPAYKLAKLLIVISLFIGLFFNFIAYIGDISVLETVQRLKLQLISLVSGVSIGSILSFWSVWYVIPKVERGQGLCGEDLVLKKLRKLNFYNPLPFFDLKKGCFVGKNCFTHKPIYIPFAKINESHMACQAASGGGKNIEMLLVVYQCILNGQGLVWIDPKADLKSPSVIKQAADKADKKFHFINLNPDQPPQLNLFANCSQSEIEELLIAGFDLAGKGTDADFYRGKDQDAAQLMAQIAIKEKALSTPKLLKLCSKISEITKSEGFWRNFKKLASLPVMNTDNGLNMEDAILNGEVVYVVGSCDSERVKMLQKMLLVRVMQVIKKRDRNLKTTPICVVLDEFKHLISPAALNALAIVRDFNAHFLLAHQSIGDLEECNNVSKAAVYGAVINNTTLKVILKIDDVEYAEKVAKLAGKKTIYTESVGKLSESFDGQIKQSGTWRQDKDYRIPPELITRLPVPSDRKNQAAIGVILGIPQAQLFYIGPIQTEEDYPKVTPADALTTEPVEKLEDSLI